VTGIAFSPRGDILAAAHDDGTVRFWDPAAGTILGDLEASSGALYCLAFSPDGKTLLTGGKDTTILLWDVARVLAEGQSRPRNPSPRELNGLWARLGSAKGPQAAKAMERLTGVPAQAVALLRDRLRPVPPVDARRMARLLADLDHKRFG